MMSRFCPSVLVLLFPSFVYSQIYFDGLYGDVPNGQGIGKSSTIEYENGYLSWGASFGNMKPYLLLVDADGNLIYDLYLEFPDSVSYQCSQIEFLTDSTFIGKCFRKETWMPSSEQGDYCMIRFKADGEVLSEWNYGYPDRIDAPLHFTKTNDGGFLISGQTQFEVPPDMDGQLYSVKIDSEGNVEWSQEYGGSLYESGGSGLQTPDGGYLLLGWTRSYGAGQRDFYLIKTDSEGNEEWYQTYGGSGNESGQSMLELSDGNYLLTGGGSDDGVTSYGRLYKVDLLGNVIWTEDYVMQSGNSFFKSVELADGSLVSTGLTTISGEGNAGWLVKTDSDGSVVWQRKYNKNQHTDLFYSLLATEDGGFLLSGQAVNEETNSQDAWLLKVDSMGCTFPNCIVGMDEEEKMVMVDVWPNPTSEVLHVQKMNDSKTLTFSVFDMNGNEVLNQVQHDAHGSIDVSKWAAGIYILNGFSDKNTFFSLKFMKQ